MGAGCDRAQGDQPPCRVAGKAFLKVRLPRGSVSERSVGGNIPGVESGTCRCGQGSDRARGSAC